jgi:predicted Zn-dependent protease
MSRKEIHQESSVYNVYLKEEQFGLCSRYLEERQETPQSLATYERTRLTPRYGEVRKRILVSVIGSVSKKTLTSMKIDAIIEYLRVFFQLPVDFGGVISLDDYDGWVEPWEGHYQYDAAYFIREYLRKRTPKDVLIHVGITPMDIMVKQLDLVYGLSGLADNSMRCCLVSTVGLSYFSVLQTVSHEALHDLSFRHCEFYQCNMNPGAESVVQNDKTPLHLCPLCEEKLRIALPDIDRKKRFAELRVFYEKNGMKDAFLHAKKSLEFLSNASLKRISEVGGDEEDHYSKEKKRVPKKQRIVINIDL